MIDILELEKIKQASFSKSNNPIAYALFYLLQFSLMRLAYGLTPFPGENKDQLITIYIFKRIVNIIGFIIFIVPSLFIALLGLPFEYYSYTRKPLFQYIENINSKNNNDKSNKLLIRTHNVGFLFDHMNALNDLRPVAKRAIELSNWIKSDELQPDVICFQEMFNDNGAEILCDGIKDTYPYIIHSVGPRFIGFSSGLCVASKFPIVNASFRRFANRVGAEKIANKGLLTITIKLGSGKHVNIYNTHLQSMLGKDLAEARLMQLKEIISRINNDASTMVQPFNMVFMGDFNIVRRTIWNEINNDEEDSYKLLNKYFEDVYCRDHDNITNKRSSGERRDKYLDEPLGTWYVGPYSVKPYTMRLKEWFDNKIHGTEYRLVDKEINVGSIHWGTTKWLEYQKVSISKFDYMFLHKNSNVNGKAEIRRINPSSMNNVQSASSDHLPIDAELFYD
jgi:endonuclease/exonuclease/phosphatase family metal-dependent hydrolase